MGAITLTHEAPRSHSLDLSVRARLIDNARKMVGQHLERIIDWNAETLSDLPDLIASKCRPNLIGSHFHVGAIAQPGFDLIAQSALL